MMFAFAMMLLFLALTGLLIYAAVKGWGYDMRPFWVILAGVAIIPSAIFGSAALFGGYEYADGEYTGTPVDIAEGGIFWHTTGVLLKTDKESSVVEGFCIVDPDIKEKLREASRLEKRVRVQYTTHFWWVAGCVLENTDVIRSVEVLS